MTQLDIWTHLKFQDKQTRNTTCWYCVRFRCAWTVTFRRSSGREVLEPHNLLCTPIEQQMSAVRTNNKKTHFIFVCFEAKTKNHKLKCLLCTTKPPIGTAEKYTKFNCADWNYALNIQSWCRDIYIYIIYGQANIEQDTRYLLLVTSCFIAESILARLECNHRAMNRDIIIDLCVKQIARQLNWASSINDGTQAFWVTLIDGSVAYTVEYMAWDRLHRWRAFQRKKKSIYAEDFVLHIAQKWKDKAHLSDMCPTTREGAFSDYRMQNMLLFTNNKLSISGR